MAMEGLGRLFDYVESASGLNISLKNASGVTFISFLDAGTQTITLQETLPDGTGDANLAIMDTYYKRPNAGGAGWTKVTQAAAATINLTTDATNDCIAVYIDASQLSAGFQCVEMTADSGVLHAIIHDLNVQRTPANLPAVVV